MKYIYWASAALIVSSGLAHATSISISSFDELAYNTTFSVGEVVTEDFETLGSTLGEGEVGSSISTNVGEFSSLGGTGSGLAVWSLTGNTGTQLALRSGSLYGREDTVGGSFFLDSNDTYGIFWGLDIGGEEFSSVSFIVSDASETSFMQIEVDGLVVETRTGEALPSGSAFEVTVNFDEATTYSEISLKSFSLLGGPDLTTNDGFSIDGVKVTTASIPTSVAEVPLPGSLALLGTAAFGLGFLRRHTKRH